MVLVSKISQLIVNTLLDGQPVTVCAEVTQHVFFSAAGVRLEPMYFAHAVASIVSILVLHMGWSCYSPDAH